MGLLLVESILVHHSTSPSSFGSVSVVCTVPVTSINIGATSTGGNRLPVTSDDNGVHFGRRAKKYNADT